jgi:hypothetical protein
VIWTIFGPPWQQGSPATAALGSDSHALACLVKPAASSSQSDNAGRTDITGVVQSDCRRPIMQMSARSSTRGGLVPNLQIVLSKQFALPNAFTLATIRNVFALAIILSTATTLYSIFEVRGLFADGANRIVHILASEDFYFLEPARKLVHLLQQ